MVKGRFVSEGFLVVLLVEMASEKGHTDAVSLFIFLVCLHVGHKDHLCIESDYFLFYYILFK